MTEAEERKRAIDALRNDLNKLRAQIDGQNTAIQKIADKVAELRGQVVTLGNRVRQ